MDFGTLIFTKPERAITDVKLAEERGFSHAWIPDSHMIWGDTYACMALAAVNTKKIKLGTGVAIASNRIAPVTVHSIATINQLAPGRVILGFGTGHTGRRVMGLPPVKQAEFREQVRVIRDLLQRRRGDLQHRRAEPENSVPASRSALHQPRRPDSALRGGQRPQDVRARGRVRRRSHHDRNHERGSSRRGAQKSRGGRVEGGTQRGQDADRIADTHLRAAPGRETRFAAREGDDRARG